jgi:hypothetical protein
LTFQFIESDLWYERSWLFEAIAGADMLHTVDRGKTTNLHIVIGIREAVSGRLSGAAWAIGESSSGELALTLTMADSGYYYVSNHTWEQHATTAI